MKERKAGDTRATGDGATLTTTSIPGEAPPVLPTAKPSRTVKPIMIANNKREP